MLAELADTEEAEREEADREEAETVDAELADRELFDSELLSELGELAELAETELAECELEELVELDELLMPALGAAGTSSASDSPIITATPPDADRAHTACVVKLPSSELNSKDGLIMASLAMADGLHSRNPVWGSSVSEPKPTSTSSAAAD